ncbi:MAG: LysM peptidoglycan-binding domain-containing protein [Gammaproteobacteria bacterium]
MRRLRQPVRTANNLLRLAIRRVPAVPALTGSLLLGLAPAGQALTLGDINVLSSLGQRLNATVPVRLGAGESLAGACVFPGQDRSDLRHVPGAQVSAPQAAREGTYELRVTSDTALYEPMYELELKVQCPGAPVMVRQYVLMLDLPGAVAVGTTDAATRPATTPVLADADAVAPPISSAAARPRTAASSPARKIEAGSRYRVAEGDTLSAIASRVQGRTGSRQAMADSIQAANPSAFIRNDANLIKLGSEIVIPANPAAPASAALPSTAAPQGATDTLPAPAGVPAPTLPQVLESVPQVQAPAETAPSPGTAASAPEVLATPAPTSASVPARTAARKPAAPTAIDSEPLAAEEPNPVVAAGAGIVFGLLVSTLLWFRGRLPARKRAVTPLPGRNDESTAPEPAEFATTPAPLVTRASEPGFSVSFTPAADDPLAAVFADDRDAGYAPPPAKASRSAVTSAPVPSEDITSELEELFDSTDTTIQKRLDAEKTIAATAFGAEADDFAPPEAGNDVDFLVGEATGEEATLRADTVDQPRPDLSATAQSPTVDLRTLASSATSDQQQAQTLLEALTLLERDYEEELTASQVLDMSAVRDALGHDADEPTQISDTRIREASARKKSR